jgi:[acyl-carrier-protein] S-malonyltransferase
MSLAFIFPGQGSQYVGMGKALAEAYPVARETLEEADRVLGRPLTRLLFEGPEEELRITWNTQPAILTVSVACLRVLEQTADASPVACAGHSLGEYSALVASGAISFADAVRTVEQRGRFMQEAVPLGAGAMAAVLGLDAEPVARICAEVSRAGAVVEVANDNSPGQVVISGHAAAVEEAAKRAREAGAKRSVPLPVSAPFHCSLMVAAGERLAGVLASVPFSRPRIPVVANVDAESNDDPGRIPELLVRQVSSPVRWQACVKALSAAGADTFVEIGPGKVLTGLVKRILPSAATVNVEDPASVASFVAGRE